jgi:hypothetical protein
MVSKINKEKNCKTENDRFNSEIYNEKYKILRDKIKREKIIKIEENKY